MSQPHKGIGGCGEDSDGHHVDGWMRVQKEDCLEPGGTITRTGVAVHWTCSWRNMPDGNA